jgi:hypothetical protein
MRDMIRKRSYIIWTGMMNRCYRPSSPSHRTYGAKGITVCQRWRESFDAFYSDVGAIPKPLSLDRIDNSKGYELGNVRLATKKEQIRNSSTPTMIEFNGKSQIIKDWAEELGISSALVCWRIAKGWPLERVLCAEREFHKPWVSIRRTQKTKNKAVANKRGSALNRWSADERFHWSYICDIETGCWIWIRCTTEGGYGRFNVDGRRTAAHRFSWRRYRGELPPAMCILHRCDNPACVNPEHLRMGTQEENLIDMVQKERHARGERHWRALLTGDQARLIKAAGGTLREVARQYGVSRSAIMDIRRGATWRHL